MIEKEHWRIEWVLMHKETGRLAIGFPVYSHYHVKGIVGYIIAGWAFINEHDVAFLFNQENIEKEFETLGDL